jgi:hypothetical protein
LSRSRPERQRARPPAVWIARAGQLRGAGDAALRARGPHGRHAGLLHRDPAQEHPGTAEGGGGQRAPAGAADQL